MKPKVVFLISVFLFEILAFIGLRGAINKEFHFVKSRTGGMKTYKGKAALRWGLFFFLGFSIIPAIIILADLKESTNLFSDIGFYAITLLAAFIFSGYLKDFPA